MSRLRPAPVVPALLALGLLASSCAYYNTLYLARKNYYKATSGAPYLVDKAQAATAPLFAKSADYSKKVIANHPKSKWVDDAYVLWARSLLGQNDPLQTVNMLQDFTSRYPDSPLGAEARFYLAVGYRQARRYPEALGAFDDFLARSPKHELTPYALLERARVLMSLKHPEEAAPAAGAVLERFPKSRLVDAARQARAEARYAQGDFTGAREDYRYLGDRALSEDDRLGWLLREADCLEGARDYDGSLSLLRGAISHETAPAPPVAATAVPSGPGAPPTTQATSPYVSSRTTAPGADRYGRLRLRIGTADLLAGRLEPAVEAYREVVTIYPRTPLAAEAQYRVGYAFETTADDFDKARAEYAKVREQGGGGGFGDQATQRLTALDRVAQFKNAGGDSVERAAESGFARAEVYLFQIDKIDRALQEYQNLAQQLKGTPYEAKALTAQAWVLSRRLDRRAEADSLLWKVVRDHPATESQLAARDYLEAEGVQVPPELIHMPVRRAPPPDTTRLPSPPAMPGRLGPPGFSPVDSMRMGAFPPTGIVADRPPGLFPADSLERGRFGAMGRGDSLAALRDARWRAMRGVPPGRPDSLPRFIERGPSRRDSLIGGPREADSLMRVRRAIGSVDSLAGPRLRAMADSTAPTPPRSDSVARAAVPPVTVAPVTVTPATVTPVTVTPATVAPSDSPPRLKGGTRPLFGRKRKPPAPPAPAPAPAPTTGPPIVTPPASTPATPSVPADSTAARADSSASASDTSRTAPPERPRSPLPPRPSPAPPDSSR